MPGAAPRIRSALVGLAVGAAGGVLAAGWLLRAPELVELPPDWTPMQANAALGFAVAGLGLVLAAAGGPLRHLASLLGVGVAALGGATLAQYALGSDLGIDQRLVPDWMGTDAAHPGRMAPNAALGLAVAGASLALARTLPMLASALGALAAALGASALLGYATGIEDAYGWGSLTRMAPGTALGLLLLGAALGLDAGAAHASGRTALWRGPLAAGLACAVVTVLFCQALALRQDAQLGLLLDAGAARVRSELGARVDARMHALRLLAREWEGRVRPDRAAWEADAELVMAQSPELVAIEWLESDGAPRWMHPDGVALPPLPADVVTRHRTVEGALALPVFRLEGGRPALRIAVPLREAGGFLGRFRKSGWLAATFDARELVADVAALDRSFEVEVASGRAVVVRVVEPVAPPDPRWERRVELSFPGGLALAARVRPSADLLAAGRWQLRAVLLAGGLGMSLLLALALGLRNVARARARRLLSVVRGHERAEEEVRRLNLELEARVRERTDELLRTNDDLRRFAAFLSHELKQPVGAQTIWAELLESRHGARLDAEGRRYVAEIRASAHRTADLISAQLDLFSVTAAELKRERVDLTGVVLALTSDLKKALEAARAQVRVGELPVVRGDARLLYQLFRNLLENSLKYRRAEVPLEVRIEQHAPADAADPMFEIVVEDNGMGFARADAERIFEPSERLEFERAEGQGLGLAVCRRIAERHGGELRASGRPGVGASFHIRLPRGLRESGAA
jgi:signal transduction histidine kinase